MAKKKAVGVSVPSMPKQKPHLRVSAPHDMLQPHKLRVGQSHIMTVHGRITHASSGEDEYGGEPRHGSVEMHVNKIEHEGGMKDDLDALKETRKV